MSEASHVITMGCGEECPISPPGVRRLDWELEDPKNAPIERVRTIRDEIKKRVVDLIEQSAWGRLVTIDA